VWCVADPFANAPMRVCVFIFVVTAMGLALDRVVGIPGQVLLGGCCWVILGVVLRSATRVERMQTLVVIVVATCFEVIGSIIWGAYIYRHHNLPMFVPPGHGLVYLFGLRLTQTRWVTAHATLWVRCAFVGVVGWGILGVTLLPHTDVGGLIGVVVLGIFLLRGRNAGVYASVFAFVAFLELYGVSMGTWSWQAIIPGTGIANGNPPSGIAAGYVFFDIAAIALAPRLLTLLGRVRGGEDLVSAHHADVTDAATTTASVTSGQ